MPASLRSDTQELTHPEGQGKPRRKHRRPEPQPGKLLSFSRHHPALVRTAMVALVTMRLRPSDHIVCSTLLLACDHDGVLWPYPRTLAKCTGLALNTVLASLRRLRALGLVDWVRVMPTLRKWKNAKAHQRYPGRVSYKEPVQLGTGEPCTKGGRVLVVRWERFGVSIPSFDLARNVIDRSNLDRSRDRSGQIDPSDPSDLSSRDLKIDCAPANAGCGTSPAAPGPESAPPLGGQDERPTAEQSRGSDPAACAELHAISRPEKRLRREARAKVARPQAPTEAAAIARAVGQGAPEIETPSSDQTFVSTAEIADFMRSRGWTVERKGP